MTNKFERRYVAKETIKMMFQAMPEEKKEQFRKACSRNMILTSWYGLEHWMLRVYKEGFLVTAEGCRCKFSAWAFDHDGELVFGRKPSEDKLHELWGTSLRMDDFSYTI